MTGRRRSQTAVATPPAPTDAEALLDALRAVGRQLRVADREAEQRVGLHPAQLHTLQRLAERPAASLAELAERTHTDPSSASVVVQRLVERGLVERTPAADDRRRTELVITAAGRTLVRRSPAIAADRLAVAVGALGPARTSTLVRSLHALSRALRQPAGHTDDADG